MQNITIDEFLVKNGISPKHINLASNEHKKISTIRNDDVYYEKYFSSCLDDFIDCVDYDIISKVFPLILEKTKDFKDVFEPCCQSGLLGCYLASNGISYNGMDLSERGIAKAKDRAKSNLLNPELFEKGDILAHDKKYDVIIGRYVINNSQNDVNPIMIEALSKLSHNIILLQQSKFFSGKWTTIEDYRSQFTKRNYNFTVSDEHWKSEATGSYLFLIQAKK
jgi:2-polyprenyl-3-methyl-5-hydroxy-6-metoxy-1,4-benzoquinol methylase